jgi:hypothetical protein
MSGQLRESLLEEGFVIVPGVFVAQRLLDCASEITTLHGKHPGEFVKSSGASLVDFVSRGAAPKCASLKDDPGLQVTLGIGVSRSVGWHKDRLNNEYRRFETLDVWSPHEGETHEIVKVLIYLQDHTDNDDGLKVVPGSHLVRGLETKGWIQLRPALGDVVVFDQRITHRGMARRAAAPRILVSYGFGKTNMFTDNFERGTKARQEDQVAALQSGALV